MQWLFFIVGIVVSIVLLFIDTTYAFGILLALGALFVLTFLRSAFYKQIMGVEKLNPRLFISYTLIVFLLMSIPLGLAVFFPDVINPFFVAGTIFLDRIYNFIVKTLWPSKEELNV